MKYQPLLKPIGWKTTILITTAALAVGGATTYSFLHQQIEAQSPLPTPSASPISVDAVAALGYLEPQGEVIQISAPAFVEGVRIEQLLVKRGDTVEAGQIIAVLDNRDRLQAALQESQTQVGVAQARLAQVRAGAKIGALNAQKATIERLRAELRGQIVAQEATIALLEAQLQGEKTAQEATVERLKAQVQNARTECGRYQMLYRDGAVTAQERDSKCLEEKTVQERLKEAEATLNQIVTTGREQIDEAKANLNRTVVTVQKQIDEATATLNQIAEVRPVDVQVAIAEQETAQAAVQRAKAELNSAYVRSPREGRILKIHTWSGEVVGDEGIVELGQTDQMYVTAEVYETDISRVRVGQLATIKSDGVIGNLQGTVDEIGLQIGKKDVLDTDPAADADARVVQVKIRLEPEDSKRVASLTNLRVNVVIDASAFGEGTTN